MKGEAAKALASGLLSEFKGQSLSELIGRAFLSMTSRPPTAEELTRLTDLYVEEKRFYQAHAGEAQQLVESGEFKVAKSSSAAEMAAMTIVCQAILNLDATIWKR